MWLPNSYDLTNFTTATVAVRVNIFYGCFSWNSSWMDKTDMHIECVWAVCDGSDLYILFHFNILHKITRYPWVCVCICVVFAVRRCIPHRWLRPTLCFLPFDSKNGYSLNRLQQQSSSLLHNSLCLCVWITHKKVILLRVIPSLSPIRKQNAKKYTQCELSWSNN